MIKQLKKFWKFLVVLLLLGLLVWNRLGAASRKAQIKEYTVTKQILTQSLVLSGKIDATAKAVLHFQSSGRLAWVGVKPGDTVHAYQAVAGLDTRDVENTLQQQLNTYMKTRWDFEQLKDDNENKIIDDRLRRILEKSQFDLNNSVLAVEIRALAVEYATLVSPISGFVTSVNSQIPGVNVTPSEAQIEVVDPSSVYLSVLADQTEVTKLAVGMNAEVIFDAYPSEHVKGTIVSLGFAPKPGESSTVYEVRIKVNTVNDTYHYRLGMTADATFTTGEKTDVLVVPLSFIRQENGKRYVMKLTNGKATKTYITLGDESETVSEVTNGLSEWDKIIAQ